MKTQKLFLVLIMVVIFLLGTVLAASAANKIRLTGGANNTYFGLGWEWIDLNISLDPDTGDAEGKARYRVYEYADDPKVFYSWVAEPICGAMGVYDGVPTMAFVIKIVEQKNIDPAWVGKYAKMSISDGGQNASQDILGIVVWDLINNTPVSEQPSCDFAVPLIAYPSQNGNLTIHD